MTLQPNELGDVLEEVIKKGDRVRTLMDIVLAEIGADYTTPPNEFFQKLKECQDRYYDAVNDMRLIIKERHKQIQDTPTE